MRTLVVLLALSAPAHADVELWTELGIKHALSRRVDITFDQHLRFDDDVSRVGAVMPEAGVRVRIQKWLRAGGGYRYEYERDGDGMLVSRHRFDGYLRVRGSLGPARFELEERFQHQLRPTARDPERDILRQRIEASWRGTKPWVPAASLTLFHALDDGARLDKLWLTVGGAHGRRGRDFEVFYRWEKPVHDASDPTVHIVGAAFHKDL